MAFSTTPISSSSSSNTALFSKNAQDPTRTAPAWTQATSSATTTASAPSSSSSATATLEKDEVAEIPQQANSWTNVLDTPRGQKARDLPGWAKRS
eukprot:CAMPEP_0201687296 /NCGR_PEP_ID=MMETSP0578-20130828/1425_1 /ASSEMBLY_ACC=CAM_ASM_000663 /TAXON_ID=267565 /ORGANISM="Skeletonema grethea, Strain CCMP 1804" /LENGTH=94 /DNA_ID=CAMNT_0048171443 /DNA_START=113 /DNA_END=397 /DNA_ORIENTATION=+